MIETITALESLRSRIRGWKRDGLRVGFVPTMGNLHAGHYSLVALARQHADKVVSSVFVNPTQFGPNEDFTRYPRTPDADTSGLQSAGCDVLWLPDVAAMYPFGVAWRQRARARRERGAGRRASPRPFRWRVHRGQPAVQPGAAGRGGVRQEGLTSNLR
jgi:pantoate--beta-alanine ligase